MYSPRTGNVVANQYIIEQGKTDYFQSYSTIIAKREYRNGGIITLDKDMWDYSVTTVKYLKEFLGVNSINDIREAIENGNYLLDNLN